MDVYTYECTLVVGLKEVLYLNNSMYSVLSMIRTYPHFHSEAMASWLLWLYTHCR